jgi:hypothetical protein
MVARRSYGGTRGKRHRQPKDRDLVEPKIIEGRWATSEAYTKAK